MPLMIIMLRVFSDPTSIDRHQQKARIPSSRSRQCQSAQHCLISSALSSRATTTLSRSLVIDVPPKIWRPKPANRHLPLDHGNNIDDDLLIFTQHGKSVRCLPSVFESSRTDIHFWDCAPDTFALALMLISSLVAKHKRWFRNIGMFFMKLAQPRLSSASTLLAVPSPSAVASQAAVLTTPRSSFSNKTLSSPTVGSASVAEQRNWQLQMPHLLARRSTSRQLPTRPVRRGPTRCHHQSRTPPCCTMPTRNKKQSVPQLKCIILLK
jgi:hypothetical protein